ncbi:MAG: NTP transferase domain-containing protein [Alicyclobacillus sp.]|nr:NTP transferase domain-containing protein [Alicyclobacillus sp.]
MKLVLLSGGSGKRLWPLSNDSRSKQFLKVLTGPGGQPESMLQRVWRQLGEAGLQTQAYVCAARAQWEILSSQIGDVPFIEEPERRDTFPAIALATAYLVDRAGVDRHEAVVVVPVDHFVDTDFFRCVARLPEVLTASGADLALLGVQPTEPTSKFGYIRLARPLPWPAGAAPQPTAPLPWAWVDAFVEKPDEHRAAQLLSEGALWNCGVFCFRAGYLLAHLERLGLASHYAGVRQAFATLPQRSFDYEVVEQAAAVVVSRYAGAWKDLGTWSSLSEQMERSFAGLGQAVACENTHVVNELGIPVVAMGLRHAVVVASPDGVLVADKAMTTRLKDVVGTYGGRPMYEERRWGTYRVLDYQKLADGTEVLTKCIELYPASTLSYQKHLKRSEVWTVIEGMGEVALDSRILPISAGDVIRIYADQWHALRAAASGLKIIEVQRGS